MNDDCDDAHKNEEEVVEEVLKHINLSLFNLSGIDLVEHLEHYEDLEDKSEVSELLGWSPLLLLLWEVWGSKDSCIACCFWLKLSWVI